MKTDAEELSALSEETLRERLTTLTAILLDHLKWGGLTHDAASDALLSLLSMQSARTRILDRAAKDG